MRRAIYALMNYFACSSLLPWRRHTTSSPVRRRPGISRRLFRVTELIPIAIGCSGPVPLRAPITAGSKYPSTPGMRRSNPPAFQRDGLFDQRVDRGMATPARL